MLHSVVHIKTDSQKNEKGEHEISSNPVSFLTAGQSLHKVDVNVRLSVSGSS